MSYRLHNWRFESGNSADVRAVVAREYWILDAESDFLPFYFSQKKKGATQIYRTERVFFYFAIESISLDRKPPTTRGEVHWVITKNLKLLSRQNEVVAPWNLSPYNFRVASAQSEESAAIFYPGVGDPIYSIGSDAAAPFVNTAGVSLEGIVTKGLSQISFSYNVRATDFDARLTWSAPGKINAYPTTVCGMNFPRRTLQIDKYDAEFCKDTTKTTDENGVETTTTWKFFRIDVALNANPDSFDRQFLNVGTHIRAGNSLARVWRWTNPATGLQTFGTYWQYAVSGAQDGEAISENMFLTPDGTAVSGLDASGRQIPTYRRGANFEPVDFGELNLPTTAPTQWLVVDE